MRKVAKEVTNRDQVRAGIAEGGWQVIYGDLINEFDLLKFIISIPTGTVGGWVAQQVQAQLQKFSQSLGDVSPDVVDEATNFLTALMKGRSAGEADFHGLGVKGGFATYNRHMEWYLFGRLVGRHSLPNNHQPFIAIRVTKPLPPKGGDLAALDDQFDSSEVTIETEKPALPLYLAHPGNQNVQLQRSI